ncbi:FUSC family protein [Synechococcus sp. RSCCF101]|uniref:FUSC family protein n=1 Tax=Synechococcus sp. RSCCF101 TaxID=2511069 RepID=UPI00124770EB|nr:FUSC family protein [Synechococcus sp. RSCCF101]QEY31151.1 FUSC family protein [Synechococcus sp. RSCCF101]
MRARQPLTTRRELRLAVITGLGAGFAQLNPVPDAYYMPLAILAVLSGSYGGTLNIGMQRVLASGLGALIVVVFQRGLSLPLPLGMGMALATTRLLGAALGLQVGYKVAGNIVVMGWLVHSRDVLVWGPLRVVWTIVGVIAALLAVRLIWPDRAIPLLHGRLADLFRELARDLIEEAERLEGPAAATRRSSAWRRQRRSTLLGTLDRCRQALPDARRELGNRPEDHPLNRIWSRAELLASQLITALDGLRSLRPPGDPGEHADVAALHTAEAEVLRRGSDRLLELAGALGHAEPLRSIGPAGPPPPQSPAGATRSGLGRAIRQLDRQPPQDIPAPRWRQMARRAILCRQVEAAIQELLPALNLSRGAGVGAKPS